MRKVDITEKLSFEENPRLVIKGKELEVNSDAPTILKVMALMNSDADDDGKGKNENIGADKVIRAYDIILPDKSKKEIERMKLSMNDLAVVINEAILLIAGEPESGE